jgi:hypothetical protein
MRGRFQDQGRMFSYIQPEKRIPANHPLRKIRELVHEVLKELNHTFGRLYSQEGRPLIPPEQSAGRFHALSRPLTRRLAGFQNQAIGQFAPRYCHGSIDHLRRYNEVLFQPAKGKKKETT